MQKNIYFVEDSKSGYITLYVNGKSITDYDLSEYNDEGSALRLLISDLQEFADVPIYIPKPVDTDYDL